MSRIWPDQTIDNSKKDSIWYAKHLDFARELLRNSDSKINEMDWLYKSYNGIVKSKSMDWLTNAYGVAGKVSFVDYRAGKTKIDFLHGEKIKIPIKSTVKTVNSDAVARKLQQYDLNIGAAYAAEAIGKLREQGVDPLEGAQPENPRDPNFKSKITPKDRYEIIMQRIINSLIEELDLVEKFGRNFIDNLIVSRMFGQVVFDEKNGSIDFETIDPRDGIWFEFDRDPFLKKSFLMGRRKKMSIEDVIAKYELTNAQLQKLCHVRDNFDEYRRDPQYNGRYSTENGQNVVEVIHIEWMGIKKNYTKKSPKTKQQKEFSDPEDGFLDLSVSDAAYENNKQRMDKDAKKNSQDIITEFTKELYEATSIGHINIQCRVKPFQMKDEDTGEPIFSYTGCVVKSVDGETISLQKVIQDFSELFNVVMYQIKREIGKMKGKAIGIDRALVPKKSSVMSIMNHIYNDSFFDFSSAGLTNMRAGEVSIREMIQEVDIGLSASFPMLLNLKNEILMMLDLMTGINNERIGNIQASATVGNTMQAVEASSTITEALFMYTHKYSEIVMMKLAETAKIIWGLHKPDKLHVILGDEDADYLEATKELADQKYAVYLTNGRKEQEQMNKIDRYVEFYANAGTLPFHDLIAVTLAESLAEKKNVALQGWAKMEQIKQAEQDKQLMAQNEQSTRMAETQLQIANDNREDMQAHDLDVISAKAQAQIAIDTAKAKNKAVNDSHLNDIQNNNLENTEL